MQKQPASRVSGVIPIDKPAGPTSHDVVAHIRRLLATSYPATAGPRPRRSKLQTKIGHTGTLDPFATGLLLIVIGPATRLIRFTHPWEKTYQATITLGGTSNTDDATGTITAAPPHPQPNQAAIQQALQQFVGETKQVPPLFSAVKINGQPLHALARANPASNTLQTIAGERTRVVTIHDILLKSYSYPELTITVTCSTGTYIRSLARDLGRLLGTGAYVTSLRRTAIGKFDIKQTIKPDSISARTLEKQLRPAEKLVENMPAVQLTAANVAKLKQGRAVEWASELPMQQPLALFTENHKLFGIGTYSIENSRIQPSCILSS